MMKRLLNIQTVLCFVLPLLLLMQMGCKRSIEDLQSPSLPTTAEIFTDDFVGMGSNFYFPFTGDGAKADVFSVDKTQGHNSNASIRIDVPNANDPKGNFAGAIFLIDGMARNLTKYNALTFYAKSTQNVNIASVGFGESKYQVSMANVPFTTNWVKYIIPIPDASKLTSEKGMFLFSAGTQNTNGLGYSFWIDDLKFEKLGDITPVSASILNNTDKQLASYVGVNSTIDGFSGVYNLPNGTNSTINFGSSYFTFSSSNPSVATVNETGLVTTIGGGTTKITAKVGSMDATGSLTLNASGTYVGAPAPTKTPGDVISLFSDAYTNIKVDFYNGYWQPYQTTQSADFQVGNDKVLYYTNFNFVGIQVTSPTVSIAGMRNLHLDMYIPEELKTGASITVKVVDFGANGAPGGNDDVSDFVTFSGAALVAKSWMSLDIPFSSFPNLTTKGHFGQIVFEGANLSSFFADNIYFWTVPTKPAIAAPVPTRNAADVKSIFSDTYTNIAGTDFNPNWGQSTVATQTPIAGNNTLSYAGLTYQGIVLGSVQDVSSYGSLHLDYYTTNGKQLKIYLIGTNGIEVPYTLPVPTTGWGSVDIPLTAFAPVTLNSIKEIKFDGQPDPSDVYVDNIYFFKASVKPTVAAPVPTRAASGVRSVFSDTYTNISGTNFDPDWGQSTDATITPIAGNNTLSYAGLTYQGIVLGSVQDVSGYGSLHLDYYTTNGKQLKIYLIGTNGIEVPYTLAVPTSGWNSVDIALTAFAPVTLNSIKEIKFDGQPGVSDVYVDNIYFWGTPGSGGGGGTCPAPPAGDFIADGTFEANAGCWELIKIQSGTESSIVAGAGNGGGNAARVKTAAGGNPGIKQTRFGVGSVLPNTTYVVKFDIKADPANPVANGSILNVAAFSEAAEGSGAAATRHDLISGEGNVSTSWTTKTITFTTAANVSGGLSLLIELIGGGPTTTGTIFIDNVSLKRQ